MLKIQKQNYNSFPYFFILQFTQQYDYENHYKSQYSSYLLKTSIKNTTKVPWFVEIISKS
jgi:hypothetical protein